MLVEFTPIAMLPQDVQARLRNMLVNRPLLNSNEPFGFEGYHIRANEALELQRIVKTSEVKPLFG